MTTTEVLNILHLVKGKYGLILMVDCEYCTYKMQYIFQIFHGKFI